MDILFSFQTFLLEWSWIIAVIFGSIAFAFGNHIDERLLTVYDLPVGVLVIVSGLFGFLLMALFGIIAFFLQSSIWLPREVVLQSIGVGVLEMIWVIPYLYATERRGAMIAGPLFQVVPVVILGFETALGVTPPVLQGLGALVMVLGGIILSIEKEEAEDGSKTHHIDWTTVGLMTFSTALVALIYIVFNDAVGENADYVAVGLWSAFGMGLAGVTILLLWAPYQRDFIAFTKVADKKAIKLQLLNELMDQGGVYLVHLGAVLGGHVGVAIGVVTAFNATQPIAILIVGALFFGLRQENLGFTGWLQIMISIGLIATGTVMVALGQP